MEIEKTNLFTTQQEFIFDKIEQYIRSNIDSIKLYYDSDDLIIFYYNNDDNQIKHCEYSEFDSGYAVLWDGEYIYEKGKFENGEFIEGIILNKNGTKLFEGTFENDRLAGEKCKSYFSITIQQGQFKNDSPYSISSYLREDVTSKTIEELNNEQIEEKNKIYTLERDETNSDIRTLTFYTKNSKIGLNRDIQIHIDENNIATLQTIDGEPTELTKEEIDKIKDFFNNIPIEQLYAFDDYLATLYYTTIMNKEKYKDINILMPDLCKYTYKTDKEVVEQTINLINKIPQNKTKGKYIVPCSWLRNKHQVNLIIDFDNNICEIVNTGGHVEQEVINNLQQELRNNFKEENWVVYENNIIAQSTGNCVIASNIVATEEVMLKKD